VTEVNRIRNAYRRRHSRIPTDRYSLWNDAALRALHQRERFILLLLRRYQLTNLSGTFVLDIGCGDGRLLQRFVDYGASPQNLYGIDLIPERVKRAQFLNPGIAFLCGSADELPFPNQSFDIVAQSTVFTSILDQEIKRNVACEMLRVLKPDGIVLWYDYHMDNPQNSDVRGVGRKEIYRLFPACKIDLKRATLAPPLARRLVPHSWILAYLLEKIPLLCTHYIGVIRKPDGEARL